MMENSYPFIDFDIGTSEYVIFFGNGSSLTIKETEETLIDQANDAVRELRHDSLVKSAMLKLLDMPEFYSWEAIYDAVKTLKEHRKELINLNYETTN